MSNTHSLLGLFNILHYAVAWCGVGTFFFLSSPLTRFAHTQFTQSVKSEWVQPRHYKQREDGRGNIYWLSNTRVLALISITRCEWIVFTLELLSFYNKVESKQQTTLREEISISRMIESLMEICRDAPVSLHTRENYIFTLEQHFYKHEES